MAPIPITLEDNSTIQVEITLDAEKEFPVNGRQLHAGLQIGRDFSNWIKQMIGYGFTENQDYIKKETVFAKNGENPDDKKAGGRPSIEYYLTVDTAKHLCMIQRNSIGMQIRNYFIQVEKEWHNSTIKPMTQIEVLHAVTGELLKQEQKLLQHDKQIAAVESQQADQAARIAAIEEKTQERVFAYPDKKKAKKLSDMMYRICETRVQRALEENPESNESVGQYIEDLKDMVVAQISERLERDLRKELKQAQEYYIKKYIDAKSKDKSPAASVLRPAEARKLTLVAYVSSDPGLYSLVKNLLDDEEEEE